MRDSPDPLLLEEVKERKPEPKEPKVAKFLLRMSPRVKSTCEEAAEREGLSLNVWAGRVLAEHAKLSREGWRSIPVTDPPRQSEAKPLDITPHVAPSTQPIIYTSPNPPPVRTFPDTGTTGTWTITNTSEPDHAGLQRAEPQVEEPFSFPENDIPDFG